MPDRKNKYEANFFDHLPKWLYITDKEPLKSYYSGGSTLYRPEHLQAWLPPILMWVAFITVLLFVMLCINVLVRRQWQDRERLPFPVVQLPLEMTDPAGRLFRNRLMWIGFSVAAGLDLLNGLNYLYPNIPVLIQTRAYDLAPLITQKPWNAMGWTPISYYPFAIGIGFLLPVDLSFSCWFFYIVFKMQKVITSAMAWDATPDFPFINQQNFGAYIGLVVMMLWAGRNYLRELVRKISGRPSELDDRAEAAGYRTAFLGAILGIAFLVYFGWRIGLPPWMGILFFGIYFALALAITRMRAELGPPVHDLHFTGPDTTLSVALGTKGMDKGTLMGLTTFYWFNRAYRGHPMAHQVEGLYLANRVGIESRKLFLCMILAGIVGAFSGFWAFLHLAYERGTTTQFHSGWWFGYEPFRRITGWIQSPTPANVGANWAMLIGFLFTIALMLMRLHYLGWPFHPVGFAISGSWSMNLVWLPLLISWLVKVLFLRYGGRRAYRAAIPFFLGLILGEFVVGSLWTLIGIFLDMPTYPFWV